MISLRPPRCVIGSHRWHHGTVGLGAVLTGIVLMIHDIKDAHRWLADLRRFTSQR